MNVDGHHAHSVRFRCGGHRAGGEPGVWSQSPRRDQGQQDCDAAPQPPSAQQEVGGSGGQHHEILYEKMGAEFEQPVEAPEFAHQQGNGNGDHAGCGKPIQPAQTRMG
jgi:hypothetical protein